MHKVIILLKEGKKVESSFTEYDKACEAVSLLWYGTGEVHPYMIEKIFLEADNGKRK